MPTHKTAVYCTIYTVTYIKFCQPISCFSDFFILSFNFFNCCILVFFKIFQTNLLCKRKKNNKDYTKSTV